MASTNHKTYDSTAPRKVAFLGLGVMGFPMAGHLALAGHDVTVYNRSAPKAEAWKQEFKGRSAPTPALAARDPIRCRSPATAEGRPPGHTRIRGAAIAAAVCRTRSKARPFCSLSAAR